MIRIALCDDEEYIYQKMLKYCCRFEEENGIDMDLVYFNSGEEFLKKYDLQKNIDVIFMDIKMKKINGVETAKQIRKIDRKVCIFFLTSLGKYSLEGYKVHALNYLKKPLEYDSFSDEMKRALNEIEIEEQKYIIERTDEGVHKVYFREIVYIETWNRNTLLHTARDGKLLSYRKMKAHETNLDQRFFRCHTAYIINLSYVKRVEDNLVILKTGEVSIPIAKKRRKSFMEALTNYFCNQL